MSKGIPETRRDMLNAKYEHLGTSKCKRCGKLIEWWLTTNKVKMPFDPPAVANDLDAEAIVHRKTCTGARENTQPAAPARDLTEPQTPELLEREAIWFAQRHSARAVIVLCPGTLKAWALHPGEDPEQLRMDLITLVNAAKRYLEALPKGTTR